MARVILLTGGNLGDVRATLAGARLKLAAVSYTHLDVYKRQT